MIGTTVYLDSSAIAKRYLAERGTDAVDALYRRAEAIGIRLAFSLWNLGEILGAIARAQRLAWITESQAQAAAWSTVQETVKLRALGALRVVPVRADLMSRAVPLLFRHGLSQPDALQIATCTDLAADVFVCADERLLEAAKAEGLNALTPVADAGRIRSM